MLPSPLQKNERPSLSDMKPSTFGEGSSGRESVDPVSYEYSSSEESSLDLGSDSFSPQEEVSREVYYSAEPVEEKHSPLLPGSRKVFLVIALLSFFGIVGYVLFRTAVTAKDATLEQVESGYADLALAADLLRLKQYDGASRHFESAHQSFAQAEATLSFPGSILIDATRFIPGLSRLASGKHAIEAGRHFAQAGQPLSKLIQDVSLSKEAYAQGEKISLLDLLTQAKDPLNRARTSLEQASEELSLVRLNDIPEARREKFLSVRTALPTLLSLLSGFEKNEQLIHELLGGNGPRTYLFLLQNNHEMRATGGFIGTYALLDVNDGVVRRFFVDGIFNPDGQLKENIIPPKPLQKVSAGWSLHDSNWFPDFPTSAEKAIFFYEKTGGPTVDGVVTLTPVIMQRLLSVIGPITLPQYGLTVDADNFIPVIQEQVEVKYDKEENKPKQILADLSELLIEKVFALQDRKTLGRIAESLVEGINEKHILLYARHPETEKLIDEVGWSGRVLDTPKDYLSVIHSNINGYKTDGVIDESIKHQAEIQDDGSVIDTVTIVRTHRGGDTPYDWWNKVNADYVRVYVPKGSTLLSSEGTTWEFPPAPLDYDRLGFKTDPDVEREEKSMTVDPKTGVRISVDGNKTVFGAWAYVSPKESVTLKYRYLLPFRVDAKAVAEEGADSYSVLFQKQAGSMGSSLLSSVSFPQNLNPIWQTAPNLVPYGRELRRETDLKTDVFQGIVFGSR